MTDFTDTIEATAASIEDLQQDLEAHLEDALGFGVTIDRSEIEYDEEYGHSLIARIELNPLCRELEHRFEAEEVDTVGPFRLRITPTISDAGDDLDGDPE